MNISKHWDCEWSIEEIFESNGDMVYIDRCYKTRGYSRSYQGYALYCDVSKISNGEYEYMAVTITDDGWYYGCTMDKPKSVGSVYCDDFYGAVPMEKESLSDAIEEITLWKKWIDKRNERLYNYKDNSFDYIEEVGSKMFFNGESN